LHTGVSSSRAKESNSSRTVCARLPPSAQTYAYAKILLMAMVTSSALTPGPEYFMPRLGCSSACISIASVVVRLFSTAGMNSLPLRASQRRPSSTYVSKRCRMCLPASGESAGIAAGSVCCTHVCTNGRQPSSSSAMKTMPQRETVAGEATDRSCTSNSMRIVVGLSLMRSPLGRHSVQLSSSTVFMFSIQIASTGPSKTTHFLSGVVSVTAVRISVEPRPSDHSPDIRLYSPYSSPILMHLGLNVYVCVVWYRTSGWRRSSRSRVCAPCSTW